MGLTVAVLAGFVIAAIAPFLHRVTGRASGWLLAAWPLGIAVYLGRLLEEIQTVAPLQENLAWVPQLGLEFSLYLDGLALLFALVVLGIGGFVLIYTSGYLRDHPQLGRLYALLMVFMASMVGLVMAGNLLLLVIFWELTGISSYLLIGFEHDKQPARRAARQALLVSNVGGLALLAGVLLLQSVAGSVELASLLQQPGAIQTSPLYLPILLLILAGVMTKSAQFPLHFWLPTAMEAPTPVSAYLHSAAMVKAGIYLLARLSPLLGATAAWHGWVIGLGTTTMLTGAVLTLFDRDLKMILAYTTICALGMMVMLLGIGTQTAIQAALVFFLAHALYKATLFMVAGSLDHVTGTRDLSRLSGLWRAMPMTAAVAALGGLSLTGVGPLLSFIGKERMFDAIWHSRWQYGLGGATIVAGASFVAAAGMVGWRPFYGGKGDTPQRPHRAPTAMWLGALFMGLAGVVLGLYPPLVDPLIASALQAVQGQPSEAPLQLWYGVGVPLLMSGISLAGGMALYRYWPGMPERARGAAWLLNHGPEWGFEQGGRSWTKLACVQTRLLQSGYLRYYLLTVLAATIALGGFTFFARSELTVPTDWSRLRYLDMALVAGISLATVMAVVIRPRLAAIAALSLVGYGVTLVYALYGAPDVAMAQFLIETLTFILFMLVYHRLPEYESRDGPLGRGRDLLVAAAFGLLLTAFVLMANATEDHYSVSRYFAAQSLTEAHGRNVVNVILVDFRGLDTLGEITVLAVAGIGVFGLLKLRPDEGGRPTTPEKRSPRPDQDATDPLEEAGDEPFNC